MISVNMARFPGTPKAAGRAAIDPMAAAACISRIGPGRSVDGDGDGDTHAAHADILSEIVLCRLHACSSTTTGHALLPNRQKASRL